MFCGKAVKLLQIAREKMQSINPTGASDMKSTKPSWVMAHGLTTEDAEVYDYVSGLNNSESFNEEERSGFNIETNNLEFFFEAFEKESNEKQFPEASLKEYFASSGMSSEVIIFKIKF